MATITEIVENNVKTTLYLSKENKRILDNLTKWQKIELVNKAISKVFQELEKKENTDKFLTMLDKIKPIKSKYTSEEMVKILRNGKNQELFDNKTGNAK